VRIEGPAAATGTVQLSSGNRVMGTLSGKRFSASITKATLSQATLSRAGASGEDWRVGATGFGAAWGVGAAEFPYPGLAGTH
jgi:hypothetical protein